MSTDLRHLSPRTLSGLAVTVGAMLALLFIAHVSRAGPAETKAATLQQRLESATVLREFDTEGAEVHQFGTAKDLVVFHLWKKDSSVVVAYGLDGTRRFRFGLPDTGFRRLLGFNLSEDGSTLVIAEVLAFESLNMRVFDISGTPRFSVYSGIEIITSPSGKYFCNRDVHNSSEILTIYDSVGHETQPLGDMPGWNCRFVTDECLIVADPDTLRFVDVPSGLVSRTIPLEFRGRWDSPPGISVSRARSFVAVYNPGGDSSAVQLFSASGELKWKAAYPDQLCTVAIDDWGQWLALQFGNPGAPTGFIKIVSVGDPAIVFHSGDIIALGSAVFGGYMDYSRFSGGVVTIAGPPRAGPNIDRNAPAVTVFLEFDRTTQAVGASATIPGLYRPVPELPNGRRLVGVKPGSPAALISVPAEER